MEKGLFSLEYLAVIVIFMSFTTYYAFRLVEEKPNYLEKVQSEIYRSECYRVSELLVNDPGHPLDWNTLSMDQVDRIGLNDHSQNKTNLLLEAKIIKLGIECQGNGYYDVRDSLGISDDFYISVKSSDDSFAAVECGGYSEESIKASVTRLVAFNSGSFGNLTVYIV